jgi:polyketide synthase PksL
MEILMLNFAIKNPNLVSILQNRASDQSAFVFLADGRDESARITYAELDAKARAIAAYLQEKNLFGERVLLLFPAGLDFIVAFMGCLYAGAIAVSVNCPRIEEFVKSAALINAIAQDADIAGVLTPEIYIEKVAEHCTEVFAVKDIFIIDPAHIDVDSAVLYESVKISDDTIAYLQYTSGSTSTPKGVVVTHKNLTHTLKYTTKVWNYAKSSVTCVWAPHSHIYGLICGLLVPIYHGSVCIIMPIDSFVRRPLSWLEAISRYRVTHSGCPNFGYDICTRDIPEESLKQLNLSSWVAAINGGDIVKYETLLQFSKKFGGCGFRLRHFNSTYGMSEVTGAIATGKPAVAPTIFNLDIESLKNNEARLTRHDIPHRKIVANGFLLPGLDAIVVDTEKLIALPELKVGEIWLSGKSVVSEYWRRPEESRQTFAATLATSADMWFRTGDLGFIHNGEICLTGRLKEVIVVYGKKYYPLDLETAIANSLRSFPVMPGRVAFAIPTSDKEEVVFLQEINNDVNDGEMDEITHSIRRAIASRFGIDLYAVILVAANSIPRTASGKLQRKVCQQYYLDNKLAIIKEYNKNQKTSAATKAVVINKIDEIDEKFQGDLSKIIADVLNVNVSVINLNAALSEYGFDSVSIIKLSGIINDKFGLSLTPALLFEYASLAGFINDLLANQRDLLAAHYAIPMQKTPIITTAPKVTHTINKTSQNVGNDVAIIGMSGVFPGAPDLATFWNNLVKGEDAITEIPPSRWHWQEYYGESTQPGKTNIKWGGFIAGIAEFDASFFNISPREAELTDPQQRILLQQVWGAIEDAGYAIHDFAKLKTGLFVGVFSSDYAELLQKANVADAYTTTGLSRSMLANRVSYLLNFNGPSEAIDTACSSSLVAIHHAVRALQNGDCEVAIVGGVNALLTPTSYLSASRAGMLSPEGKCKTFDSDANGYVRGEGVGVLVLKPLVSAIAAGDIINGVIKGTAVNHGGHVSSLTVPNPHAQAEVIIAACNRANISADTISYIETHGTGTSLGDPIEINGLKKAFSQLGGAATYNCALGAVKTNIGHLESAAGIAGVIKTLLAMRNQYLPANLHLKKLNTYIELTDSPFYLLDKGQPWLRLQDANNNVISRRAGISSFGFGGTNAHVVLEEYVTEQKSIPVAKYPELITFSAKTALALTSRMEDLQQWLQQQISMPTLSALAYTLNQGRDHFDLRSALVVNSVEELLETLTEVFAGVLPPNFAIQNSPDKPKHRPAFQTLFKQLLDEIKPGIEPAIYREKLITLANFYVEGYEVDWARLVVADKTRLRLPTYPFAKEHHWLVAAKNIPEPQVVLQPQTNTPVNFLDYLKSAVAVLLKINPLTININTSLTELGFDSITFKELAAALANDHGIEATPAIFYTYKTIAELNDFFTANFKPAMRVSVQTPVSQSEPVAIIGMYGRLPQSENLVEFWRHLQAQHDLVTEVPAARWNWREYYGDAKLDTLKTNSKWGAFIEDVDLFDASFFKISAREANLMDPQHRIFMEVVWKTIEDAGYDPLSFGKQAIGLFAGVEFSEYQTLIHANKNMFHGHVATGNSHALLANRISYFLNLRGPSEVIDTACSSSLVAIHRAVSAIRNGECETAIAGGVSLMLNPETFVITSQLGALSPDGRCKTFDKSANGYVKGEGAVALFLKPLSKAQHDGDEIYGVIRATNVNHGGKAQSLTAPDASAQSELIIKAYQQAGIDPATVTYIETHGTGTELGDPIEIEGLKQAFKTLLSAPVATPFCGLGSVKTNIGHLEPASGVAGIVKVLLAMRNEELPGLLHLETVNPYINLQNSPFYLVTQNQPWRRLTTTNGDEVPRRAGVSSFGFGGTNAHVVLEQLDTPIISSASKPAYLITLSAKQMVSLKQKYVDLLAWLQLDNAKHSLAALSFTLNIGRTQFDERAAIVVDSLTELSATLKKLINDELPDNVIIKTVTANNHIGPIYHEIYQSSLNLLTATTNLSEYREQLFLLADLYLNNYPIDWRLLYNNESMRRIAGLPGYPFIKQRYWFDAEIVTTQTAKPVLKTRISADWQDFTLKYLQAIFAEKLTIAASQIAVNETYEVYGVDSLLGLEITNRLEVDFGTLPKTLLYERNTLNDLAAYFLKKHQDKLQALFAKQNPDTILPVTESVVETHNVTTTVPVINNTDDIAIIGLQGIYPMANDLDEFWDNLVAGRNCVGEVPVERWNYRDYPVKVGGAIKYYKDGGFIPDVDKFDPLFFSIAPRDAALMDPQERLFMQASWAVLEDAGYTREKLLASANNSVGVFAGVTYNFYPLFIAEEWFKGNRIPLDIQNFSIANHVSYFLNLNGPSYVIDTACSSSLAAIHLACESLARGECKLAIAGGVNLTLHPCKFHMLGSYSFMSEDGRCASFAEGGAGYVPSEGVGTVLLKPLAAAIKDQDKIYGVIRASSMNHGGKTSGYTVPNPNAHSELIKSTLTKAKINPRAISYIEAHGTGTSLGDPIEVRGLQEAFEDYTDDKQFCALGSVKSNIGHLESAAGISQLTKVLLQMQHKTLVPSIHAEKLNPFIDFAATPFFVQRELTPWLTENGKPRLAGISSFGAGGTNVHLIVEEYIAPPRRGMINSPFIFILSALNLERLQAYALNLYQYLIPTQKLQQAREHEWLNEVCFSLQTGRENMVARLAIIAESCAELTEKLLSFHREPRNADGIWFNSAAQTKSLASDSMDKYELAQQWVAGAKIAWDKLYDNQTPQRISLPSYPFAKRRCWVPTTALSTPVVETVATAEPAEQLDEWLYTTKWEAITGLPTVNNDKTNNHWLIFSDKELGFVLQDTLGKNACTYCFIGDEFVQQGQQIFYINPEHAEHYQQLFERIFANHHANLRGIIYLWPCIDDNKNASSHRLLNIFQTMITKNWHHKLLFNLVTRGSQSVFSADAVAAHQHYLWSMTRIFAAEQGNYQVLLLDLDSQKNLRVEATRIVNEIYQFEPAENHIAYRQEHRYAIRLLPYVSQAGQPVWSSPIAALVTGGLGALGFEVALWLAKQGSKYLLLTGNTVLPARNTWDQVQDNSLQEKIASIRMLEKMDVKVVYASVNVIDKIAMSNVVKQVELEWRQTITGVFHLAGITTDSILIDNLSHETLSEVLAVKQQGALVLDEIFNRADMNCFVLFSSIASMPFFGMSGLSAYAMANEFLNGLAASRRAKGLPAISISWAAWADKGMSHRYNHSKFLEAVGMSTISIKQGITILNYLLTLQPINVVVFKIQWQKFLLVNAEAKKMPFFEYFSARYTTAPKNNVAVALDPEQITDLIITELANLLELAITEVDVDTPYQNYGMDSIIGINFVAKLGEHFPDVVSPMDLYRFPTLNQLSNFIVNSTQSTCAPTLATKAVELDNLSEAQLNQLLEDEMKEIDLIL